ncbi:MAG TPA: hypothetical protein VIM06_10855 [Rhodanobacter sp.]
MLRLFPLGFGVGYLPPGASGGLGVRASVPCWAVLAMALFVKALRGRR